MISSISTIHATYYSRKCALSDAMHYMNKTKKEKAMLVAGLLPCEFDEKQGEILLNLDEIIAKKEKIINNKIKDICNDLEELNNECEIAEDKTRDMLSEN